LVHRYGAGRLHVSLSVVAADKASPYRYDLLPAGIMILLKTYDLSKIILRDGLAATTRYS